MPGNLKGYWTMVSNENFGEYLRALGVNQGIVNKCNGLTLEKSITQDGEHICIETISMLKNYDMDFYVGREFEELLATVDGRKCLTVITWDIYDRLVCVQKGEIEGRGWTHWVCGDELHLELRAGGVVAKQVFRKTSTDMNGYWKMISNENWEAYGRALDVNVDILRKVNQLELEINHDGDHITIKCNNAYKNYAYDFCVGKEWEEVLVPIDGRKVLSTCSWDIGGRLVCVQKGEVGGRGWAKWVVGDELHLELKAGGVLCKQVYKKA